MIVITVARKPTLTTVAANALEYGTGGLNIDSTRIPTNWDQESSVRSGHMHKPTASSGVTGWGRNRMHAEVHVGGRWPANLILSSQVTSNVDAQGESRGVHSSGHAFEGYQEARGPLRATSYAHGGKAARIGDSGGASRFFKIVGEGE